jgi:hypothetical protein
VDHFFESEVDQTKDGHKVGSTVAEAGQPSTPEPPRRPLVPGALLVLIKGVFGGVGGVYIATGSVLVTAIAAAVATVMVYLVLSLR